MSGLFRFFSPAEPDASVLLRILVNDRVRLKRPIEDCRSYIYNPEIELMQSSLITRACVTAEHQVAFFVRLANWIFLEEKDHSFFRIPLPARIRSKRLRYLTDVYARSAFENLSWCLGNIQDHRLMYYFPGIILLVLMDADSRLSVAVAPTSMILASKLIGIPLVPLTPILSEDWDAPNVPADEVSRDSLAMVPLYKKYDYLLLRLTKGLSPREPRRYLYDVARLFYREHQRQGKPLVPGTRVNRRVMFFNTLEGELGGGFKILGIHYFVGVDRFEDQTNWFSRRYHP